MWIDTKAQSFIKAKLSYERGGRDESSMTLEDAFSSSVLSRIETQANKLAQGKYGDLVVTLGL